jgi:GDP-4-dehydro-6-deoxy-D-mannose reductase
MGKSPLTRKHAMRVLVTGACGFVGKHVLTEFAAHGYEVIGLDIGPPPSGLSEDCFIAANITDAALMVKVVADLSPDACVHLAGLAFAGGENPQNILTINLVGATNVLEAFRLAKSKARILFISSAHVYGMKARPAPIKEDDPLNPDTFYSIAKMAADRISLLYANTFGLDVMVARPHNHIGSGQSPQFAIASFARQVKAISTGASPVIKVGNLDNRRDLTDVRDIARAYRLLLEKGQTGKPYNIASGREIRIGDVLDKLCVLAGVRPKIVRDETLYRPLDQNPILDTTRLREDTGWQATIPIEKTLTDMLADL